MKKIKRDSIDSDEGIEKLALCNTCGLQGLAENDNFDPIRRFAEEFRPKFQDLDGGWTLVIFSDAGELARWKERVERVNALLAILELNNKRHGLDDFDWGRSLTAMGWLLALFEASQRTLELNSLPDELDESPA